jgi:protoporphyrinogen IX oxidase
MSVDIYLLLKALHVAAAMAFVGGMLVASLAIVALACNAAGGASILAVVRRWDARVTTPAMVATWGLGLTIALRGDWFPSGWLLAKLVVVVLLSGLHGVLSGRMRRMASGVVTNGTTLTPILVIVGATWIALLAVVKPF